MIIKVHRKRHVLLENSCKYDTKNDDKYKQGLLMFDVVSAVAAVASTIQTQNYRVTLYIASDYIGLTGYYWTNRPNSNPSPLVRQSVTRYSPSVSPIGLLRCIDKCKGQNPLHQFPRNKCVTSWRLPRSKTRTSLQHKRRVRNKLTRAKVRCVCMLCRVVSQIPLQQLVANLLRTCCGLVGRDANKSATSPQQVGVYGEVTEKRV